MPGGISLPQEIFAGLMARLKLPRSFFQLLLSGTSKFIREKSRVESQASGFAFRTPLSRTEDWTLALYWDRSRRVTNGLIHGLEEVERATLLEHMADADKDACHPMLLPIILCEMLAVADANGIRANGSELSKVEFRTNFSGFYKISTAMDPGPERTPEKEFAEMTRMLNYIISRLAFHEMRMQANICLTRQIREHMSAIEAELSPLPKTTDNTTENSTMPGPSRWVNAMHEASHRLSQRVSHLEAEHQALLLEIACHSKIAQSQLQIIYNLIAQRDNKDNLKMAQISTRIANTTKNDSYAMRTLALMSVIFLPATFIASFFSMGMFDWQAPEGSRVVTPHLWIYWAITVPLTLIVTAIWLMLFKRHLRREKFPFETTATSPAIILRVRSRWAALRWKLAVLMGQELYRENMENDGLGQQEADVSAPSGASAGLRVAADGRGTLTKSSFEKVRRVNTVVLGPRR
ncbi:hypothetical protein BDW71DRAFT_117924 [Aspergillus fruticulosus]